MDNNEIIAVVHAHTCGADIQAKARPGEKGSERGWVDVYPNWDFYRNDFRRKPEPREWWILDSYQPQILNYKPVNSGFIHVREVIE